MAGEIRFDRGYAAFQDRVREFERAPDVGYIVTEFMQYNGQPYYPIDAVIESNISSVWLGEGEPEDTSTLDILFRLIPQEHDAPVEYYFYEIVMRGGVRPYYAGFVDGSSLSITDEIVNGHRVIETDFEGNTFRWTYQSGFGNGPGQYRMSQVIGGPQTRHFRARGKRLGGA